VAMGLGAFIAAALGMAATGAMGEIGRQKREEKHQADQLTRQLMLQHIQQYALTPGEEDQPIEEMLKNAGMGGSQVKALAGLIRGTKQAATQAALEQTAKTRGALQYFGLPPELAGPGGGYPNAKRGIPMPAVGGTPALPQGGAPQLQPGPISQAAQPSAFLAAQAGSQGALAQPPVQPMPAQPGPRLVGAGTTLGTTQGPGNVVTPLPSAGAPALAVPAGAPAAQTVSPAPAAAVPTQTGNPEFDAFARLMGPVKAIGPATLKTFDLPGVGKLDIDVRGALGKEILGKGSMAGVSPRTLSQFANAKGATINPEAFEQYRKDDFAQWFDQYATAKAKGRPWLLKNPDFLKEAAWKYAEERGGSIENLKEILPGPEAMNNFALGYLGTHVQDLLKPGGFAATMREMRQQGITMDPKTEERAALETQGLLRQLLVGMDPRYATNENALQQKVNEMMGFVGVTPEQFKTAAAPATVEDIEAAAVGKQIPTKAQLGKPGQWRIVPPEELQRRRDAAATPAEKAEFDKMLASGKPVEELQPGGVTETAQALQQAKEAQKAREAEAGATGVKVGGARGAERAKAIETVSDPVKLNRYVDRQGNTPEPQTQVELDAKIKRGELGLLNTTPDIYKDYTILGQQVAGYQGLVDRPGGIFEHGWMRRIATRMAAAPFTINLFGFDILTELPPLTTLRGFGMSDQHIEDMNKLVSFNRLAVAHLRALGEKGQGVSSKLFVEGAKAFPGPLDDKQSAQAKIKALQAMIEGRLKASATFQGETKQGMGAAPSAPAGQKMIRVKGPNGQTGSVPEGTVLPPGWTRQ